MKSAFHLFRQTSTFIIPRIRSVPSRNFSIYLHRPRSPFLELFARNKDHRSVRHLLRRRHYSSQEKQTDLPSTSSVSSTRSLSDRFKDLSRKYGWAAVGTYALLSVLDYPLFFMIVYSAGTERIGQYEHAFAQWMKEHAPFEIPEFRWPWSRQEAQSEQAGPEAGQQSIDPQKSIDTHNQGEASIWTIGLLAYVLHKSFIFLRIPLTIAITPRVVKQLRAWGWNIGQKTARQGAKNAIKGK